MTTFASESRPHSPRSEHRVSVWAVSSRRTGPYLGGGVLAGTDFVVLHPKAASALRSRRGAKRARVAVDTPVARYVVDGTVVLPDEAVPVDAVALELDMPIAETPEPLPAPGPVPATEFEALERFLAEREARDTTPPPEPPEETGYTRRPQRVQAAASKPWWCRLWPGCPGCR